MSQALSCRRYSKPNVFVREETPGKAYKKVPDRRKYLTLDATRTYTGACAEYTVNAPLQGDSGWGE